MLNRSEEDQDIEDNTAPMTTNEDKKEAEEEERGERSKDEETDEEEEEGEEEEQDSKKEVLVIKNAWKDLADTAAAFPAQLNMDECPPLRGYEGTPKCGLIYVSFQ
jgi:negative regulator of genetic competence, sporulation and motility